MERLEDIKNYMKNYLIEGEWYGIYKASRDSQKRKIVEHKNMRLVKKHKHHALFEDKRGTKESIPYRDLYRQLICGEEEPYVY